MTQRNTKDNEQSEEGEKNWEPWEEIEELDKLATLVIGCAITVAKKLRPGYLEKVYENALFLEMSKHELLIEKQVYMDVRYDGVGVPKIE